MSSLSLWSVLIVALCLTVYSCKKTTDDCTVTSLSAVSTQPGQATLKWSGGTAPYAIQYREVGTSTWNSTSSTTDSVALRRLAGGVRYEWQIKAACASTFTASDIILTTGCDRGYEGDGCATEIRAKFIGSYTGTQQCDSGSSTGTTPLVISASNTDILAINVVAGGGGSSVSATVISDSTFSIPAQSIGSASIQGSGTLSSTGSGYTLVMTYTTTNGGTFSTCIYTGVKQ